VSHHLCVVAFTIILGSVGSTEIELPFLNLLAGPDQAGLFKVANALAMGAALLAPGVLSAQLLPMMANAYGRGREQAAALISGATAWLFVLGAPLIALGIVFSKELIHLLYGPEFAPAAQALSVLMVGRVASTLGQGASAYLVSADRQTALMKLTLLFTALRLIGAAAGTYCFGLMGAAAAAAVLSVLGSASTIALALRETRSSLPWGRLLRIATAAALGAACSSPAAWLEPPLLGLAVGGIVFLVVYPLALWLLRCLHDEDAEYVRQMLSRLSGGRLGGRRTG
ncbi:MAG: polysaccharide biosynthesis C-terminal domain-containing protein, partial [Pseudoxanthomonas sp.]